MSKERREPSCLSARCLFQKDKSFQIIWLLTFHDIIGYFTTLSLTHLNVIVFFSIIRCREARSAAVEQTLRKLGVERLGKDEVQKMQWEVLEAKIGNWIHFMRIAVRNSTTIFFLSSSFPSIFIFHCT